MSQHSSSAQDIIRKPSLSQANFNVHRIRSQSQHHSSSSVIPSPINENVFQFQPSRSTGLRLSKRGSEISSTNDNYTFNNYTPLVKYENSYRIEPDDGQKFNPCKIKKVAYETLEKHFKNFNYDSTKSKEFAKIVSDEIKIRIKPLIFKRYKIIVNLTIGQSLGQNVMITSRSLWNAETDNSCTIEYTNKTMFALATVFVTYYD
jgi:hypothetical protein